MRIFVVENYNIQKLKSYIFVFNEKLNTDEKENKIIIINADNIDRFIPEDEIIGGDEIYFLDMLTNKEAIKELLRMEKKGTVYVNVFGCGEDVKEEFIEYLQQYRNYFEKNVQNLILIDAPEEISNLAMRIESSLFVHQSSWTEKDFKDYVKRQKKEVFRFKYIYNRKYVFDLFLMVGKIKRKLGLIK